MHKVWVVLKREYLSRVNNKTFLIMTFAAPVLIAVFYAAIFFVATRNAEDNEPRTVLYSDQSGFFGQKLDSLGNFRFKPFTGSETAAMEQVKTDKVFAFMDLKDRDLKSIDSVRWISRQTLSIMQTEKVSNHLATLVYKDRLGKLGLSKGTIDSLSPKSKLSLVEIDASGDLKNSSTGLKSGIGMGLAIVIYFFIFIYGSMVMRSAMEEKTNRIVEVIVSSIKPFQMMMGKILGVALVGLTQFAAWIILSMVLIGVIGGSLGAGTMKQMPAAGPGMEMQAKVAGDVAGQMNEGIMGAISNLPFAQIIAVFLLFFLGGYLLYSSMFAAIGSAVNQETDVQQFMFPVSMPLVFGFVIAQSVVFQDPNGSLARIFSYIPFTSPVVMVVRSPFGISWSEILLSFALLAATFVLFVWLTGRIYRVGILMYGKKPTWKQLISWIFMKD